MSSSEVESAPLLGTESLPTEPLPTEEPILPIEGLPTYAASNASNSVDVDWMKREATGLPSDSSVPWPGSTYIIKCVMTGKVLTLHDGRIVLSALNEFNSVRWKCVEKNGYLGFKDPASGLYLGYDRNEELCCRARRQQEWENFCVRQFPNSGYLLYMSHYENALMMPWKTLRPLGRVAVKGKDKLTTVVRREDATVWHFTQV